MTEAVWVTAIGGIVTIVSVALNTRAQSKKLDAVKKDVDATLGKQTTQAAVVEEKVDAVAHTVNSKADTAAKRIESLEAQIGLLTGVLSSLSKSVRAANGQGHEEKPK